MILPSPENHFLNRGLIHCREIMSAKVLDALLQYYILWLDEVFSTQA